MSLEVDLNLLIDLITQYPLLYDIKDKNYKNNNLKEKCWEEISLGVAITVEDCKRLWRNLRDRFNKEKRLQAAGSEASESSWRYFSKMLFYSKYSMSRKTVVATPKLSIERPGSSSSDSHAWCSLELSEIAVETNGEEEFASTTIPSQNPHTTSYEIEKQEEKSNLAWAYETSEPPPKKIKQERSSPEDVTIPAVCPLLPKNDVNDHFGSYVVSRLKEMHPAVAKQKRKNMLVILEEDD